MFLDISAFDEFYASPLGRATSVAIETGLKELWPSLRGQHCLGVGYPFPCLELFQNGTASEAAITPARLGARAWGDDERNCTAMASLQSLPLASAAYDRIFMMHALDFTRDRDAFLKEIERIMAPGGEIALVVANRVAGWARSENTPFGQGEPFSRTQIIRLIEGAGFTPVRTRSLLHFPPSTGLVSKGWAKKIDKIGSRLWPGLGGISIIIAQRKQLGEIKVPRGALKVSPAAAPMQ